MADTSTRIPDPLPDEALGWCCPSDQLPFDTTAELQPLEGPLGQERALEALGFALAMMRPGYNAYALGSHGLGKHEVVRRLVEAKAAGEPLPPDLAYVTNFEDGRRPRLLELPPGRGRRLRAELEQLLAELLPALRNAFENEEFRNRRRIIEDELKERQEQAVGEVEAAARAQSISLIRMPQGFAFAPMADGRVLTPERFHELPEPTRRGIEQTIEELQKRLQEALSALPQWTKESRDRNRALTQETAGSVIDWLFRGILHSFADLPAVTVFLEQARADIVEHVDALLQLPEQAANQSALLVEGHPLFRRYRINLVVDHSAGGSAPVIHEDDPTYDRLIGRIEQRAEMGALVTDTLMIRGGALHSANGGYLLLDAERLLVRPFAYDVLKRALRSEEIRIESPLQAAGLLTTVTLEPEPTPLAVKVVLVGERLPYYLLSAHDPEFDRLFKVAADFDETVRRTAECCLEAARLIATIIERERLRPFGRDAVGRVLEDAARRAGDAGRLAADLDRLADLLREADYQAGLAGRGRVEAADVQAAIDAHVRRLSRIRELSQEQIVEGTIGIATSGAVVGQINGLSVLQFGGFAFGRPTRITARVRTGGAGIIDIEREVRLGGPLHSKGVLILTGYLAAQFVPDLPMALSATLVFEQSYGGVDGDSASSAELYALLSAIAGIPIRQGLAVTGSINQRGEIQAIGGVNEKIEGFFDLCAERGLDGTQGVLIPATNRRHLMLHERVRRAVAAGKFKIHAVETAAQGIELLTGRPAGARDAEGRYPDGTVFGAVEARLRAMAERRRDFGRDGADGGQVREIMPPSDAPPPKPPEPTVGPPRFRPPAS